MKNMLTLVEQETIITWDRSSDDAEIYTCEPRLIKNLAKYYDDTEARLIREDSQSATYMLPKSWIKIRKPSRRNLTDKQRHEIAERLKRKTK